MVGIYPRLRDLMRLSGARHPLRLAFVRSVTRLRIRVLTSSVLYPTRNRRTRGRQWCNGFSRGLVSLLMSLRSLSLTSHGNLGQWAQSPPTQSRPTKASPNYFFPIPHPHPLSRRAQGCAPNHFPLQA